MESWYTILSKWIVSLIFFGAVFLAILFFFGYSPMEKKRRPGPQIPLGNSGVSVTKGSSVTQGSSVSVTQGFENPNNEPTRASDCNCLAGYIPNKNEETSTFRCMNLSYDESEPGEIEFRPCY